MAGSLSTLLHHYGIITNLPPLWNNIGCALLTVVYIKNVMDVASFIRTRLACAEESRKFVHIFAGNWILFWGLFDATHWSWRLNILVPSAMSLKLLYKGAILADPNDIDVKTMSRSSSPSELLYGPLQFVIVMMWLGTSKFMTMEGAILMAALGIGDGIAPLIGKHYGRIRYRFPFSSEKTVEGSFGVFLGTVGGCYFYLYMLGLPMLSYRNVLMCGFLTTITEAIAPKNYDNVLLPIVLNFALMWFSSIS